MEKKICINIWLQLKNKRRKLFQWPLLIVTFIIGSGQCRGWKCSTTTNGVCTCYKWGSVLVLIKSGSTSSDLIICTRQQHQVAVDDKWQYFVGHLRDLWLIFFVCVDKSFEGHTKHLHCCNRTMQMSPESFKRQSRSNFCVGRQKWTGRVLQAWLCFSQCHALLSQKKKQQWAVTHYVSCKEP